MIIQSEEMFTNAAGGDRTHLLLLTTPHRVHHSLHHFFSTYLGTTHPHCILATSSSSIDPSSSNPSCDGTSGELPSAAALHAVCSKPPGQVLPSCALTMLHSQFQILKDQLGSGAQPQQHRKSAPIAQVEQDTRLLLCSIQ